MLLLSHISIKLWSIQSIGSTLVCLVHLVYSVLFDPLRFNSIQFGFILSILVPLRSTLVLFGLFNPIRSYQSILSIWSTSVHSVHSNTIVHLVHFGQFLILQSTSVLFNLIWSIQFTSVHFSLFRSIQSTWSTLILFSPIKSI